MTRAKSAVLSSLLLVLPVAPGHAVECQSARGHDNTWWSYRLIDSKKCWYRGYPGKSKLVLHWSARPREPMPVRDEAAEAQAKASKNIPKIIPAASNAGPNIIADRWPTTWNSAAVQPLGSVAVALAERVDPSSPRPPDANKPKTPEVTATPSHKFDLALLALIFGLGMFGLGAAIVRSAQ